MVYVNHHVFQNDWEINDTRLEVFQDAFKILATELKTSGGLLERIRVEYEQHLNRISRELRYTKKENKRQEG